MALTPAEVDAAIPVGGTPSRSLTNAAVKQLITDVAAKPSAFTGLTDAATADLPAINGPLAAALAAAGGVFTAPEIVVTGEGTSVPPITLIPPKAVYANDTLYQAPGVWLAGVPSGISGTVETLGLNNIVGMDTLALDGYSSSIQDVSLPELKVVVNVFSLTGDQLANVDMPLLRYAGEFNVIETGIITLDAPALEAAGDISIYGNLDLEEINLGALVYARNGLNVNGENVTSFDISSLVTTNGGVDVALPSVAGSVVLALEYIGDGSDISFDGASSVDMSALLTFADTLTVYTGGTLDLSGLESGGGRLVIGADSATSFSLPALLALDGDFEVFGGTFLDETSVDGLLVKLASLDGTGGTTSYDNNTVTIAEDCAPPSATGLAAKGVLELRGNTVNVNS